jgi:hypothetical protein
VICVGTPQRGSFSALDILANGARPAPLGRWFRDRQIVELQTVWDLLPHPEERVFVDESGEVLDLSLYDPDLWSRFALVALGGDELASRLDRARLFHEALDRSRIHSDIFVVGGRHVPSIIRARVSGDRVQFPPCKPPAKDPLASLMYEPGDSMTTESSLRAIPGLSLDHVRWVSSRIHHSLPADPEVHRVVLESLLAT